MQWFRDLHNFYNQYQYKGHFKQTTQSQHTMRGPLPLLAAFAAFQAAVSQDMALVVNQRNSPGVPGSVYSLPVDISSLRNNRGFAMIPNDADFDGLGSGYPAQYLPAENFTYGGVDFIFPQYQVSYGSDNVIAQGQALDIPRGRYVGVHMLAAAHHAIAKGYVNATYTDGSTTSGAVLVDPFWAFQFPYGGDIIFPYYLTNESIDYNRSSIFRMVTWLDSTQDLMGLQLPNVTSGSSSGPLGSPGDTRLHIFAVSMLPAPGDGLSLGVQLARSTNMWFEGTNKTQIFEAIINNIGTEWILANQGVTLTIEADGVTTVQPGYIKRLRPGDQARVQIGVVNADGVAEGSNGTATLIITGSGVSVNYTFSATYGIQTYEPTYESIYTHEAPPWYNNAKYGIFIRK